MALLVPCYIIKILCTTEQKLHYNQSSRGELRGNPVGRHEWEDLRLHSKKRGVTLETLGSHGRFWNWTCASLSKDHLGCQLGGQL